MELVIVIIIIIISMIFNNIYRIIRPMVSFWAVKIDKKMLFLEFPRSNTAGTLLVSYI
jgi:hypothetical protein